MTTSARGARRRRVVGEHDLIDDQFLPCRAVGQADERVKTPQPAGYLEQLASVNPPGRQWLDVRRVRTQHEDGLLGAAQPPCEVPGQWSIGSNEHAPVTPQRKVAGRRLHLCRLQRCTQQASGLGVCLLRVGVHPETGLFEIGKLNLRIRAKRRYESIFKAGRRIATGDHGVRAALAADEVGKCLQVTVGMGGELDVWGRKVEPLGVKRQRVSAVTKEHAPLCCHIVPPVPSSHRRQVVWKASRQRKKAPRKRAPM